MSADFNYSDLLPLGADETEYRLLTTEGVSTFTAGDRTFLQVQPEVLQALTAEAMHDISHYLRTAHLAQLRRIIDDPEASGNDRFVALDLLKNANISAGGVLPMCQDTGTAIVMGKKSEGVLTGAVDEEWISRGVYDAYTKLNLRYSQMAPLNMWDEKNTGSNLPAQIELYSTPAAPATRRTSSCSWPRAAARRTSRSFPGDEGGPEPVADDGVPGREDPLARYRGLPAVPPGDRGRRHVGRVRAEDREVRLRALPRHAADHRIAARARVPGRGARGGGLQAHAGVRDRRAVRRKVLLPRRPRDPAAAARRVLPGRDRGVVLGGPPGAGEDHAGGCVPRAARARPGAVPAGHHGRAPVRRRRGRADRPEPADERDPRRAVEAAGEDAAVAERSAGGGAGHRAREDQGAAGRGRADAARI